MEEKHRRAYHEAGHAVASVRFGRGFWEVNIFKGGGLEGYERLSNHKEEIIVLLTGYAAEVKSSPEMEALITSECLNNELQGDFPNARYEMQCIDGPREEYDLEYWKARARQFIEGDWKAKEAVAVELLQRCRLTSCEVKQIMSFTDSRLS
jgi:hypothetical protein